MFHRFALTASLTLLLIGSAQATELELMVSDKMGELTLAHTQMRDQGQNLRFGAGVLYNDDSDLMGNAFLQISNRGRDRWQPLSFSVGGKLYGGELDRPDESVAALALGGDIGVGIPAQVPMAVVFTGYISPNVTTSGDTDRITELMVRLEAELTRGAHVFAGYRQFQARSSDFRNVRLDDGPHAGVRLNF